MPDRPSTDPFFPEESPVPQAPEHPRREREHAEEWIVVDRVAGEGGKSRLQSEQRRLEAAGIRTRLEHDDHQRIVLEVQADRKADALEIIGEKNAQGVGEKPHHTAEEKIEAQEKAARTGVFNLATVGWVLVIVAIAVRSGIWCSSDRKRGADLDKAQTGEA